MVRASKPSAPASYLFAAQWEDQTYEVVISSNGEAERRYEMATGLGGPKRVSHGRITGRHTDVNVRGHIGKVFGIAPESLVIQYFGRDCPMLKRGAPHLARAARALEDGK